MLVVAWLSAALAAEPIAGLEWRPLSRADLVWVDDGRSSGTTVGEEDGTLVSNLRPFAGAWLSPRIGLVGGLGVAHLSGTSWTADVWRRRSWTVLRPELDLRVSLRDREAPGPRAWGLVGGWGDLPVVRDASNGFSDEEAQTAADGAWLDRARLGGVGGRLGAGAEVQVVDGLWIGAQWTMRVHTGVLRTPEVLANTTTARAEAAVLATFAW